ncbi:MAG: AAA family ATPase [Bryobacterales bacterium]|nr:AAA family ATPase [Bryobacterales bacterium]
MTPDRDRADTGASAANADTTSFGSLGPGHPSPINTTRTILLLGPSGGGKTVFALQNLIAAIEAGHRGVFVSFDESPAKIRQSAASFGWNLPALEDQRRLLLHARVRPHMARAGQFAIEAVLTALTAEIRRQHIRHVVFDGLHVMLALLDSRPARLQAAFRLRDWIHEHELSTMFTYCVGFPQPCLNAGMGPEVIESIADCVVALEPGSEQEPGRRFRFVRYRCATLPPMSYSIRITNTGVELVVPPSGPAACSAPLAVASELNRSREVLSKGLRQLHWFLGAKQAELDLLIEKRSNVQVPVSDASSR